MSNFDFIALQRQFSQFTRKEIEEFHDQFKSFDIDGNGSITHSELGVVMGKLGMKVTSDELVKYIEEVDSDKSGTVEFNEFLQICANVRSGKASDKGFANVYTKHVEVTRVQGAHGSHSFAEEEKESFVDHINDALKNDKDLKSRLPIKADGMDIFKAVNDGILLCKLINDSVPETIDERTLNTKQPLNQYKIIENQNLCVNSAKAIGCNVVNIGSRDLMEGTPHLVLGLIWQIVKIGLFRKINLTNHPGLVRLLEEGETLADLLKLPPDQILLRWFNYHLKAAGWNRRVKNFTSDIKDSENYIVLLNQIAPQECSRQALNVTDVTKRADAMLSNADKIGCRKYVKPRDVVNGNAKLNLAFVANLFNTRPALEPVEVPTLEIEETREEKAYRIWLNHFGFEPQVIYIYEDLKDGLVLLKVFDKISPGIVDWKKVNQNLPLSTFKKIENTNYVIVLGKQLKFSLVGISGKDLADGNKMFTLALLWQMMRYHCVSLVQNISKSGKEIKDSDIVDWANAKVQASNPNIPAIGSFKDPSLATGVFLIEVVRAVEPRAVNVDLVNAGANDDEKLLNAKYALSIARKTGAVIFLLPEDIVEVKPKMILTFVAAMMTVEQAVKSGSSS